MPKDFLEHHLSDVCDSSTILLRGDHHFFQPGATIALSTIACCVALLVNRHLEARKLRIDPRIEIEEMIMSISTLPRELQRAIAHELTVAFPDMPPIRDFCSVGMMAPTALEEVKDLYLGHPSAAAAILRRGSMAEDSDFTITSLPKRLLTSIWERIVGRSQKGVARFDSLGGVDVEMGEDEFDDDDDGQSVVSRASSVYTKGSVGLSPPLNGSPVPGSVPHLLLSPSTSDMGDVDVDMDEELLDSELQQLSENDSSDDDDLHKQFPFCPLPKPEAGTMVDKAFSETGSFSDFNANPTLSRTSSRYFAGQSSSVDLDGITIVDESSESESLISSSSEDDSDSDDSSVLSFSSASVNLDGSFQQSQSDLDSNSLVDNSHKNKSMNDGPASLNEKSDDEDEGEKQVPSDEPFRPQFGHGSKNTKDQLLNKVNSGSSSSASQEKLGSADSSNLEENKAERLRAQALIEKVSRGEISSLEADQILKKDNATKSPKNRGQSSPPRSAAKFLYEDEEEEDDKVGVLPITRVRSAEHKNRQNLFNLSEEDLGAGGGSSKHRVSGSMDSKMDLKRRQLKMANSKEEKFLSGSRIAGRKVSEESTDTLLTNASKSLLNSSSSDNSHGSSTIRSRRNQTDLTVKIESSSEEDNDTISTVDSEASEDDLFAMLNNSKNEVPPPEPSKKNHRRITVEDVQSLPPFNKIDENEPMISTDVSPPAALPKIPSYSSLTKTGARPSPRGTSSGSFSQVSAALPSPRPRRNSLNTSTVPTHSIKKSNSIGEKETQYETSEKSLRTSSSANALPTSPSEAPTSPCSNSKEVKDTATLSPNVMNEAKVIGSGTMELIITVLGGSQPIIVKCEPNDTVIATKRKLAKELGSPLESLKLIYAGAGRQLQNGRTLTFYGIANKTGLQLSIEPKKSDAVGEDEETEGGKGLRRRSSASERANRSGRGSRSGEVSPRGGRGGEASPHGEGSQSFDRGGRGRGLKRGGGGGRGGRGGGGGGGAPSNAINDDSEEESDEVSNLDSDADLSFMGGGGPGTGEDDDSDSDNTVDTTITSVSIQERREQRRQAKKGQDPFHKAKVQRVHNIVEGLDPDQLQSLLKGLMEGGMGDESTNWRKDRTPQGRKDLKAKRNGMTVVPHKKEVPHTMSSAFLNASQAYQIRYKSRIVENKKEGRAWWRWVDHSASSSPPPLDDSPESTPGGSVTSAATATPDPNQIADSFRFDTTAGVNDGVASSAIKSNRKMSKAEKRAAKKAKKKGTSYQWEQQHQRRVRRLESYHQRALQKRLLRVLKEGTARAHYEAGDREDLLVTMMLLCCVLVVSLVDFFIQAVPDGNILFCQIPYILSVIQFKAVAIPLWFLLAVVGQFTELEGKFGDSFEGFFGVGRDPYVEGTIWGSLVTRSTPTIGVLALLCAILCPWYLMMLPFYAVPVVVFCPAILLVVAVVVIVIVVPPSYLASPPPNDERVIRRHLIAEKALSNSTLNKSRVLERRSSIASISAGKVSLPPLTLPHPATPASGATAFSAFCAIWRRAQYYAPLSRRRRAMIQREINERNQLLGNDAHNIILSRVYDESARIAQDFEDEENALRFEPNITESIIVHMIGAVQILGFLSLCLPLIEFYHFRDIAETFEALVRSALSPISLSWQVSSFFTWPVFASTKDHRHSLIIELIAGTAIVSIFLVKVIIKSYLRRSSGVSSLRMKAKLLDQSMNEHPTEKTPQVRSHSTLESNMSSSRSVSSIAEEENASFNNNSTPPPSYRHHMQRQHSQQDHFKQHQSSSMDDMDNMKLNNLSNVLLYFEEKIIHISGMVTWRVSAFVRDIGLSLVEESVAEIKSNDQNVPPGLYGRDESKGTVVNQPPEGAIGRFCFNLSRLFRVAVEVVLHLVKWKGSAKDQSQHRKKNGHQNNTVIDTGLPEITTEPKNIPDNMSSSSSMLDRGDQSFSHSIKVASFGVGVACIQRWPPKIRVFGCRTFDGEILSFLANDEVNRLFKGIAMTNNRRLTGADCRHSAALAGFGTAIGTHFGCSSLQPPPVIMPAVGSCTSSESDDTAAAFGELSPPLLFLLLSRCLWFQRISITNCPGLVGSVFSLTPLAELTHLELGGGMPDGYEHGFGHYGKVYNDKEGVYGDLCADEDKDGESKYEDDDNSDDVDEEDSEEEEKDASSIGMDLTGHEFRISIKGVSGRLIDLKAFTKLIVLNLSGTSVTGNITVLEELSSLQVLDLASTAVEGDIKALAKCTELTDVNFWGSSKVFGDVGCFKRCKNLRSVIFVGCRQVRGNIRVFEHTPLIWRLFFYHSQLAGMLSPKIISLICNIRKHTNGIVRLWKCGRFVLPSDLSEISEDLRHLDLSGITTLEGNIRVLATTPNVRTVSFNYCPAVNGDINVLEHCPHLRKFLVEGCDQISGSVSIFNKTPDLVEANLTDTNVEGGIGVFTKSCKKLKKARVRGTRCYEGAPPNLRLNASSLKRTGSF